MNVSEAKQIIESLAQGVDPSTGEVLPDSSPINQPRVIRALFMASQALQPGTGAKAEVRERNRHREMAGKPWTEEEDKRLLEAYDAGATPKELAVIHLRKLGGIESRLVKHGRLTKK